MANRNRLYRMLTGLAGVLIALALAAAIALCSTGCLSVKVDSNAVRVNDNKYEAPK